MNVNERAMAVLRGELPDKVPWVARMVLWYVYHKTKGTLPEKYRDWELWDIQRDLGMGVFTRAAIYKKKIKNVEVVGRQVGADLFREYRTPVGTVTTKHSTRPDLAVSVSTGEQRRDEMGFDRGNYAYQVEHMIKDVKDYAVAEYIIENTEVVPNSEEFVTTKEKLGGDGVVFGQLDRIPIQELFIHYVGFNQVFFHLNDHLNEVEHFLKVLTDFHKDKLWPACLESPAEVIHAGANLSGVMTSPSLFEKYFAPYSRELSAQLHKKGKLLGTHLDGEPKPLLNLIPGSGLDVVEAFTPAPMFHCTVGDARKAFGGKVIILGGIPSVLLVPDAISDEQFETQMAELFREIAPGDNFILGVGDNIMPEASLERVKRVAEMVKSYGTVPIPAVQ